jgi:hypothetical protein
MRRQRMRPRTESEKIGLLRSLAADLPIPWSAHRSGLSGLQPAGHWFESGSLHRPGRCANRIVLLVSPANGNTEDRVDGLSAVHPDLVDECLEQ